MLNDLLNHNVPLLSKAAATNTIQIHNSRLSASVLCSWHQPVANNLCWPAIFIHLPVICISTVDCDLGIIGQQPKKPNMFWELIRPFSSGRNTKLSTSSIFSTVNSQIVGLVHLNSSATRILVASIRIRVTSKCDQETFWKKLSILYNGSLSPG